MQSSGSLDLQQTRQIAETVARKAATVLLDYIAQPKLKFTTKANAFDIVTEADKAAEIVIVEALQNAFPDHHFVGEEGGGTGAPAERAEYLWYIDPIDGTTNYANRIPYFSTSIALADRDMNPLVGVVYNPIADELFSAVSGQGATLNGNPVRVSSAAELVECVLVSGFPYNRTTGGTPNLPEWVYFLSRVRDMRRFGSAALDLCNVAVGRFDGYWEMGLNPWDYLAGALCVAEAGGRITDYAGNSHIAPTGQRALVGQAVAANPTIHPLMLEGLDISRRT